MNKSNLYIINLKLLINHIKQINLILKEINYFYYHHLIIVISI